MPSSLYFKLLVSLIKVHFITFIKNDIFIISFISLLFISIKAKNLNILFIPYFFIFVFKSLYVFILNEFFDKALHHDIK